MSRVSEGAPGCIHIGSWRFDPEFNRLRNSSSVIQLEPKAARVLQVLAEQAGEPVTRRALLDSVWGDVVVGDDALTQVIIKLRKALGDDARNPRYIQTIPKRGYCLLADVTTGFRAPEVRPEPVESRFSVSSRHSIRAVAIAFVLLSLVIFGYLYTHDPSPSHSATEVPDERISRESATLMVMPFAAITGGEREQRFARGIRADLITDLAGLSNLSVITVPPGGVGQSTTRYRIYADVQQAGERIGVHVRLVETTTQRQLWSQRYERTLDDIFQVQHSISLDVVAQLALEVPAAERQRLADRYTPSLPAYEDFLRGQADLLLRERESNASARAWYQQAIAHDPNFARAYAGLALSYAADYRNDWTEDGTKALRLAQEMAHTGAQIDPDISEVHWVLGYVAAQNRKHEMALTHLQRALEADHSYADAYALMGGINTYIGRPERSIGQLRNALRLKHSAGYLYYLLLGRAYYFLGRYEQAKINLGESLARNPTHLETHIYLFATAVSRGDVDSAEWEAEEILMIAPGFRAHEWLQTYPMTDNPQIGVLTEVLARIGR